MATPLPSSALVDFIRDKHPEYYGKVCELRSAVQGWLTYITQTFPHYTKHTIEHSDEIVYQISSLLFKEQGTSVEPVVRLSGVEAYILVAAAYLHDAGMVTSNKEQLEILASEEWEKWTTGEGGGASHWNDIKRLKDEAGATPADATRDFLIDVQLRFLIAEFIRSSHHIRAGNVIQLHHEQLGRIDFGSPMLREAISQVCIGHGLKLHELDDKNRFPDLRDIKGEKVNLRFLAILLRLGDLLDMSAERACPLILTAASPLPPDSFPHWEQYTAITHRATSPESIEISAECPNQDIHRILQDWCQWIVEEVRHAKLIMPKCQRHSEWQVPDASIEGDSPTIQIIAAEGADYVPSKWVLKFDQQAIFERLSESVYSEPLAFIRELLQNSLDAIRCRMYLDLASEGKPLPDYPTQVDEEFRKRYKVNVSISERFVINPRTGNSEMKHVLVIEDNGIGMDADIIEKYFLQVGRSYYTSDEFRRNFQFPPTSRFGIGFLSVFAVSDNVVVDTYKPTSETKNNEPIRIRLSGFRNYLLREKSERRDAGTRIEIILRDDIEKTALTDLITKLCKRVEFPINVDDFSNQITITAEEATTFTYEQTLITNPEARFILKSYPIDRPGLEGDLYVFAYLDSEGESWSRASWAKNSYSESHPLAEWRGLPSSIECLHGIVVHEPYSGYLVHRIDCRSETFSTTLDRSRFQENISGGLLEKQIASRWGEILDEHMMSTPLATSDSGWKYKQKLVECFPLRDYWISAPKTLRVYMAGSYKYLSIKSLMDLEKIHVLIELNGGNTAENDSKTMGRILRGRTANDVFLNAHDLTSISDIHRSLIFSKRVVNNLARVGKKFILVTWVAMEEDTHIQEFIDPSDNRYTALEFEEAKPLALAMHSYTQYRIDFAILLNKKHHFFDWMNTAWQACRNEEFNLKEVQFKNFLEKLTGVIKGYDDSTDLDKYLADWRDLEGLPDNLYPPEINFTRDIFRLD